MAGRRYSDHQLRSFFEVAAHALPHRRLGTRVVSQLTDRMRAAGSQHKTPYFTHCHLAATRGVKHRNTSRQVIAELKELGLIFHYPYRAGLAQRFVVCWSRLWKYKHDHDVRPLQVPADQPVRTKADWDAERKAEQQCRDEARSARLDAESRQRQRDRQASHQPPTPEQLAQFKKVAGFGRLYDARTPAGRGVLPTVE